LIRSFSSQNRSLRTPEVKKSCLSLPPAVVASAPVIFVSGRTAITVPVVVVVAAGLLVAGVVGPGVVRVPARALEVSTSAALVSSGVAPGLSCIIRGSAVSVRDPVAVEGQPRLATAVAVVVEVTTRTARIATVCVAATAKKELVAWCLSFLPSTGIIDSLID